MESLCYNNNYYSRTDEMIANRKLYTIVLYNNIKQHLRDTIVIRKVHCILFTFGFRQKRSLAIIPYHIIAIVDLLVFKSLESDLK